MELIITLTTCIASTQEAMIGFWDFIKLLMMKVIQLPLQSVSLTFIL